MEVLVSHGSFPSSVAPNADFAEDDGAPYDLGSAEEPWPVLKGVSLELPAGGLDSRLDFPEKTARGGNVPPGHMPDLHSPAHRDYDDDVSHIRTHSYAWVLLNHLQ